MKVLIADDSVTSRAILKSLLARWGHDVVSAVDGLEAWKKLIAPGAPKLAIVDWMMPEMDGIEVCRRVRSENELEPAYIILLTARVERDDVICALDAGVDDYVSKPFDADVLRARIGVGQRVLKIQKRVALQSEALDAAADAVVISSGRAEILWVNRAFTHVTGYAAEEVVGAKAADLKSECGGSEFYDVLEQTIASGDVWRGEIQTRRKDGERYVEQLTITPLRDGEKFIAIRRDVTEQKSLENQLRHAQKLESIGRLASGIAHEINTPVQFIGDNTRFLQDAFDGLSRLVEHCEDVPSRLDAGIAPEELAASTREAREEADVDYLREEIPRAIEQTLEGVSRVANIVSAMKSFAHADREGKVCADLNAGIENTITISKSEWKYVAEMKMRLDPGLPAVSCLAGEVNQVVLNLIVNAAHAIENVVGREPDTLGEICVSTSLHGKWVEIRVADNGSGIPEDVQPHIFDPFFTTKEVGKGSGQGLALAYAVAEKHGGTLTFETEAGRGTTFIMRLPLESSAPSETEREPHTADEILSESSQ